ncbi:uncharacterized protein [Argopecten irradians]|uniref:uncharacterized protein isoform X1 n=1 Tax=Argopecten irradians TaxID=31199 RepID=UPI00371579D4
MGKRKKILKSDFALKTPINEKNVGIAPRKRRRCKPEDTAKTFLLKNEDQPGFEDRYINDFIGRGVFALRFISKGDFLLEYAGKLIEGKAAEIVPDTNYTFHFVFKGRKACVDATEEPTEGALLGRLVNHAKRGIANSTMRLIDLDGTPRLCLFSLRDIAQGEELRYDYGIDKLPWENQFAEQESSETIHSIPEDENDDMAIGRKESSETIHSVPEDENDDMAIGRNQESSETIHSVPEDRNDDMTIGRNESSETIHSVPEDENDDIAIGRNQQLSETMHSVPEDGNGDMAIGRNQQSSETIHSVPEDRNDDMAIGRNQESSETIHSVTEDENDDIAIGRNQQSSEKMHSLPEDGNGDLAIGRNISTSDDISVNVDDDPIDSISESDVILESEDEGMENVTCDIIPIAPITHYPTNFYGSIVVISATGEDGAAFPLTASTCLIGRSKNCDIIINREMIAPEHCKLSVKNNRQVYLDNLCTTHSVQIDKKNVRGSTRLYHDDVISVGDRSFRFQYPVSSSKNMEKRRRTPQNDIEHSENDFSMSEDDSDADPDYKVPEISSESDDEDEDETARSEIIPIYSNKTHQIMQRPIEEDNVEPTLITDPVDGQIVINETTAYKDGRRVVDKQHNCLFCNKLQLRIGRHLQTVHKNEPQVQQILGTSMKKEKEKKLDKLRLEGDYKHNINVLKSNTGFLILARRPSSNSCKQKNYLHTDFLPCEFCLGFFLKTELWRHRSNCLFAPTETKKHTRVQRNSVLLLESSVSDPDLHKGFRDNVVSTLIVDDISLIIRNDRVILKVGENLYLKHGKKQKPYISQEIRLLGRLVMEMRATVGNPNGYLKDFLKPAFFDSTIEACQNLSGIEQTNDACKFRTPSVALKCGPILKKCCVVLKGQALRNSDDT